MTTAAATCAGCAQCQRRFRSAVPRLWCQRFHQPALARCVDYRPRRTALDVVRSLILPSRPA